MAITKQKIPFKHQTPKHIIASCARDAPHDICTSQWTSWCITSTSQTTRLPTKKKSKKAGYEKHPSAEDADKKAERPRSENR